MLINNLDLTNNVLLMGKVDNIRDKIKDASLFVMSSDYEGVSNALMEALALGIPSISTDSDGGGARMLIEDGQNGILVPIKDETALAKKMEYILSDSDISKKLSENAIKSMKAYNPDVINKKWEEVIISLCKKE